MCHIRVVTSCYNDEHKLLWIPELLQRDIPYIIYKKNNNINDLHKRFENVNHQCIEISNQ